MRLIRTRTTIDTNGNRRYHATTGSVRIWQYQADNLSGSENDEFICNELLKKLKWDEYRIVGRTFFKNDLFFIVKHKLDTL